jgi:uncharacterized protein (DUF1499 family)
MRNPAGGVWYYLHLNRGVLLSTLFLSAGACAMPAPRPAPSESEFRTLLAQGQGSNIKVTVDGHADPALRPHQFPASVAEVRGRVISAVLSLPRWQVQDTTGAVLWVMRTTRLFRFVDDLYILVEPRDSGSAVLVRSASRVGEGDLGQNRRNIIELWTALERGPWTGSQSAAPVQPIHSASLP